MSKEFDFNNLYDNMDNEHDKWIKCEETIKRLFDEKETLRVAYNELVEKLDHLPIDIDDL